jgi:hypothetical protein
MNLIDIVVIIATIIVGSLGVISIFIPFIIDEIYKKK